MSRLEIVPPSQPCAVHIESRNGSERQTCRIILHRRNEATIYPEEGFKCLTFTLADLQAIVKFVEDVNRNVGADSS